MTEVIIDYSTPPADDPPARNQEGKTMRATKTVAEILQVDASHIRRLAIKHDIGEKVSDRVRVFSDADIVMIRGMIGRTKAGRPKKIAIEPAPDPVCPTCDGNHHHRDDRGEMVDCETCRPILPAADFQAPALAEIAS